MPDKRETAPAAVQPAPEQVQAPGIAPLTHGRMRRYARVGADNRIKAVEGAGDAPTPAEGERVVDVTSVAHAFPGCVVDAVGNVSLPGTVSAQAAVPEVTPATVPVAPLNAVPLPQNPALGG